METCELVVIVLVNFIQINMLGLKRKKLQMNISTIWCRSWNSSELPKNFQNAQQAVMCNTAAETKCVLFLSTWGDIDANANVIATLVATNSGITALDEPQKKIDKKQQHRVRLLKAGICIDTPSGYFRRKNIRSV